MDGKPFKGCSVYFVFKKAKETKNTPADYQAKKIIFSMDLKATYRIFKSD